MFSTSDIGWVVGHSYIVYGPLIAGMATILYEGLPIRPDAGIWWRLVEKYRVTAMFTSPTAIRVLKKQDPRHMHEARPVVAALPVSRRRAARRTDRALGRRRARQAGRRQLLADRKRLADPDARQRRRSRRRARSAARRVRCTASTCAWSTRRPARHVGAGREGRASRSPAPTAARLHADRLGRRRALRRHLFRTSIAGRQLYIDFRLGDARRRRLLLRAGPHRRRHQRRRPSPRHARDRGERSRATPDVAEVAVVGVADALKGQVPVAFAVVKDAARAAPTRAAR